MMYFLEIMLPQELGSTVYCYNTATVILLLLCFAFIFLASKHWNLIGRWYYNDIIELAIMLSNIDYIKMLEILDL